MTAHAGVYDHVYAAVALLARAPAPLPALLAPLPRQRVCLLTLLHARARSVAAFLARLGPAGAVGATATTAAAVAAAERVAAAAGLALAAAREHGLWYPLRAPAAAAAEGGPAAAAADADAAAEARYKVSGRVGGSRTGPGPAR